MTACMQKDGGDKIPECNGTACAACRRRVDYHDVHSALLRAIDAANENHVANIPIRTPWSDREKYERLSNIAKQVMQRALCDLFPSEHEGYPDEWTKDGPESEAKAGRSEKRPR